MLSQPTTLAGDPSPLLIFSGKAKTSILFPTTLFRFVKLSIIKSMAMGLLSVVTFKVTRHFRFGDER
jgi:hypothetical protein